MSPNLTVFGNVGSVMFLKVCVTHKDILRKKNVMGKAKAVVLAQPNLGGRPRADTKSFLEVSSEYRRKAVVQLKNAIPEEDKLKPQFADMLCHIAFQDKFKKDRSDPFIQIMEFVYSEGKLGWHKVWEFINEQRRQIPPKTLNPKESLAFEMGMLVSTRRMNIIAETTRVNNLGRMTLLSGDSKKPVFHRTFSGYHDFLIFL